jgi:hypothetical protein
MGARPRTEGSVGGGALRDEAERAAGHSSDGIPTVGSRSQADQIVRFPDLSELRACCTLEMSNA